MHERIIVEDRVRKKLCVLVNYNCRHMQRVLVINNLFLSFYLFLSLFTFLYSSEMRMTAWCHLGSSNKLAGTC